MASQQPNQAKAPGAPIPPPHHAPDAELRDITEDLSQVDGELTETRGFAWTQNIRLILAIGVVIVSAMFLWWLVT